jgi:2-keto-4-pentenoate hydratase/2-oxohepta-3-ene-1,7-dioic acid hydratase in catechol pathway
MRLVTFKQDGNQVPGIVVDDVVVPVAAVADRANGASVDSVTAILAGGADLWGKLSAAAESAGDAGTPLADVELDVPVPNPQKIICIGMNYSDHIEETKGIAGTTRETPDDPVLFAKWNTALLPHEGTVLIPSATEKVDWEAELAVVIGKRGVRIPRDEALSYVGGYTAFNDVSARDLQLSGPQWTAGKSPDTFAPVGPWVVTADELADASTLSIKLRLNGETMQDANTSQLIHPIDKLIEFISAVITLEPGDIIATGTPSGVGLAMDPPFFIQAGDVTEVEIEGIGVLRNNFAAAPIAPETGASAA